jgi:Flp pilus assembly protein TadG
MRAGGKGQPGDCVRERRRERGSEMLEFAFVVTVLMTLLMGIVTFARAYNIYESITRAAREGARMAVLPNCATCGSSYIDPSSGVTQASSGVFTNYIAPVLQSAHLDANLVQNYSQTVGWLDQGATEQQCGAIISFRYPFRLFLPFTRENLVTLNISTRVQMRREGQPEAGGTCP